MKYTADQLRSVLEYKGGRVSITTDVTIEHDGKPVSRAVRRRFASILKAGMRLRSPVSDHRSMQPIDPQLWMSSRTYRALVLRMARQNLQEQ